jgi:hypothetical protein
MLLFAAYYVVLLFGISSKNTERRIFDSGSTLELLHRNEGGDFCIECMQRLLSAY